ncbi:hypothetical protein [Kineosporia sp. A_224]|uniref:hypothetical protein n=1 Tax=Kineosporia sp. A_224 TaxID=1962180 RepID=UPI000B4AB6A8|nr:hypothetical protein [Kineosporia sp. A_224]
MAQQPTTSHPVLSTAARVLVRAGAVAVLFLLLGAALRAVERLGGNDGPAGADIGGGIALIAVMLGAVVAGGAVDGYRRGFRAAATDWALTVALLGLTAGGFVVLGTVNAVQDRGIGGMSTGEALTGVGAPLAFVVTSLVVTAGALAAGAAALAESAHDRRAARAA